MCCLNCLSMFQPDIHKILSLASSNWISADSSLLNVPDKYVKSGIHKQRARLSQREREKIVQSHFMILYLSGPAKQSLKTKIVIKNTYKNLPEGQKFVQWSYHAHFD